eukprot:TRINITY_DN17133_c0_g3_i1.p1 TRINITY_DN17133_c0_g3~~TRINITY_DN17133_c0_g3_i1.p1  ORF type:complete len:408 (+),score=84.57 TRINITY_DN17133_c0_g3_i1:81-1304(+)
MSGDQKVPQFRDGGPKIVVRNTFLDFDEIAEEPSEPGPGGPASLVRARTGPAACGKTASLSDSESYEDEDEDESPSAEDAGAGKKVIEVEEGPGDVPGIPELTRYRTANEFENPEAWNWAGGAVNQIELQRTPPVDAQLPHGQDPGMGHMMPAMPYNMPQPTGPMMVPVLMPINMAYMGSGPAPQGGYASNPVPVTPTQMPATPVTPGLQTAEGPVVPGLQRADPTEVAASSSTSPAVANMELSADEPAPPPILQLTRSMSVGSGCNRVKWPIDAKKLKTTDKNAVSPLFEIVLGNNLPVTFRMMMYPSEAKGRAAFRKSKGKGYVHLKCEADEPPRTTVAFRFAIGKNDKEMQAFRGPVFHDYSSKSVAGLPPQIQEWDFQSAIDQATGQFFICLELFEIGASPGN